VVFAVEVVDPLLSAGAFVATFFSATGLVVTEVFAAVASTVGRKAVRSLRSLVSVLRLSEVCFAALRWVTVSAK